MQKLIPVLRPGSRLEIESSMQRLRLKADGRIVELRDGQEFPLAPAPVLATPVVNSMAPVRHAVGPAEAAPAVRDLRRRARLTQLEFASRLGVPVETIRNWEQGKRLPRGPCACPSRRYRPRPGDGVFRASQDLIAKVIAISRLDCEKAVIPRGAVGSTTRGDIIG